MGEEYSQGTTYRREQMRVISGMTGVNLAKEKRFDKSEEYIKPFAELKDITPEELAQRIRPKTYSYNSETGKAAAEKIAKDMISIAKVLSKGPTLLRTEELEESGKKLQEILDLL